MPRAVLVALLLQACAPTVRLAGHCPTIVSEGMDFSLSVAGLAGAAIEFDTGGYWQAGALATAAMALALVDNLVECGK